MFFTSNLRCVCGMVWYRRSRVKMNPTSVLWKEIPKLFLVNRNTRAVPWYHGAQDMLHVIKTRCVACVICTRLRHGPVRMHVGTFCNALRKPNKKLKKKILYCILQCHDYLTCQVIIMGFLFCFFFGFFSSAAYDWLNRVGFHQLM